MDYLNKHEIIEEIVNSPSSHILDTGTVRDGMVIRQNEILDIIQKQPAANVIEIPESGIGDLFDGYHTFNELYHHRAVLFSVICNILRDKAWKSKLHHDGSMYDGMFIVGIETSHGHATYHYDIDPYWDMFHVEELEKAPEWDGHTPEHALERISRLSSSVFTVPKKMCKDCEHWHECTQWCKKYSRLVEAQDDEFYCFVQNRELSMKLAALIDESEQDKE